MAGKTDEAWEYTSPLGTKLNLARCTSGTDPTRDFLKASFGNGSYPSNSGNPLFAVQIGLIPLFFDTQAPFPVLTEWTSCITDSVISHANQVSSITAANAKPGAKKMPYPVYPHTSNYAQFNLSQDKISPATQNDITSTTVQWGLSVGADVASDPTGTLGADFSTEETRNISDLQVYDQIYNTPGVSQPFGTIWQMVFTRKDGMNLSSFQPRCDVQYSCPKGSLDNGIMWYLLVEKLVYWGPWSDRVLGTGASAGIGLAAGLAGSILFSILTLGLGAPTVIAAAGAAGAGGAAAAGNDQHNALIDAVNQGDETQLMTMWFQAKAAGKASSNATLLSLDLTNDTLTTLGTYVST